jgi:molecular chaperone GrpE
MMSGQEGSRFTSQAAERNARAGSKRPQTMKPKFQNPLSAVSEANGGTAEVPAPEPDLLRKELAEHKERNLRLTADFENFKRRSRQESEARAGAQKESFIHELLPAIDNLERALAAGASASSRQVHQGVEMTLEQLRRLLRQHGIETEAGVGQPFDPHRHEAVSQRHDPAQPNHSILEVFQRGYRRGEKVFRPAKVVVNDLTHTKQGRHGR